MAARKKQRKSARAGCLLWLAAFLLLLVLFLVKFSDIKAAVQKTGFLDAVSHAVTKPIGPKTPTQPQTPSMNTAPNANTNTVPLSAAPSSSISPVPTPTPSPTPTAPSSAQQPGTAPTAPLPGQTSAGRTPEGSAGTPADLNSSTSSSVGPSTSQGTQKTRSAVLYFVRIDDSGAISSQKVKRLLPISDSPIQDTLDQLMKGPTQSELRMNLISLIPLGTKVRGISIRGSTAIVDFSDDFLYNRYGMEGYVAQLRQIVYTLTEFANISEVRFLIEGKPRDYITEGVSLDLPWSRASF